MKHINKKMIMIMVSITIVFLLVGLSIASGVLSVRNPSVEIKKEANDYLTSKGLNNPETTELSCDEFECEFQMYKGNFKLGSHTLPARYCDTYEELNNETRVCLNYTVYTNNETGVCLNYTVYTNNETGVCLHHTAYTDNELAIKQDEMIADKLEFYAEVFEARENNVEKTPKLGAGTITIVEKKI